MLLHPLAFSGYWVCFCNSAMLSIHSVHLFLFGHMHQLVGLALLRSFQLNAWTSDDGSTSGDKTVEVVPSCSMCFAASTALPVALHQQIPSYRCQSFEEVVFQWLLNLRVRHACNRITTQIIIEMISFEMHQVDETGSWNRGTNYVCQGEKRLCLERVTLAFRGASNSLGCPKISQIVKRKKYQQTLIELRGGNGMIGRQNKRKGLERTPVSTDMVNKGSFTCKTGKLSRFNIFRK